MNTHKHINLPVYLCQDAVDNGYINPLKLFVYFKFICSGHFRKRKGFVKTTCREVKISRNSFYKSLKWLISHRFVTVNSKRKSYRIVGFDQLYRKAGYVNKYGAFIERGDLNKFRAFVIAAVMTYVSQKVIKVRRGNELSEVIFSQRTSRKNSSASPKPFVLPIKYYANVINKTEKTARNHRRICETFKYLQFIKQYELVSDTPSHFSKIKKYHQNSGRLVIKDDNLCLQESDILISKILLRKRRSFREKTVPKKSPYIYTEVIRSNSVKLCNEDDSFNEPIYYQSNRNSIN